MGLLNHEPGMFIWEIIAFSIFLVILKKMAWKPLLSYLRERRKTISDSLTAVEKVKLEIYQLKKESEVLISRTAEELIAIQKDTKGHIENMLLEAEKEAKADYELIIKEARFYIQRLEYQAIYEVKNKTGTLVLEITEKLVIKELSGLGEQERHIARLLPKTNLTIETCREKKFGLFINGGQITI